MSFCLLYRTIMMSYQQFIHVYDHKNNILGTFNSESSQRIQCTNLSKYVVCKRYFLGVTRIVSVQYYFASYTGLHSITIPCKNIGLWLSMHYKHQTHFNYMMDLCPSHSYFLLPCNKNTNILAHWTTESAATPDLLNERSWNDVS